MRKLLERCHRALKSLGRFPARRVTWLGAALFSVWAVLDVMVLHLSQGLAQPTYDAMVRARMHAAPVDPRLVIIDIDEASLARMGKQFGQWPWPRDTLATVLDFVDRQRPAAVVWDVIFSDPDRLSPGGDAAFEQAAVRSPRSHFAVVRLPHQADAQSKLTQAQLPRLWVPPPAAAVNGANGGPPAAVALIPPDLPGIAAARLGYNNGYPDSDGVLRRFRYAERLADGSVIRSLPLSVVASLDPVAHAALASDARRATERRQQGELIDWRARPDAYPRVSFADVFALAEHGTPKAPVPSFAGKVVIVGATAPSLHDVHPTPLSADQHGVESLATVIDNALNRHHLAELPLPVQAALACALFVGIALWVDARGVSSLAPATLVVPAILLGIGYLSLSSGRFYLDLQLAAGLGLVFLAVLRVWNALRRDYWFSMPEPSATAGPIAAWAFLGRTPWTHAALDSLLNAVQRHAPDCRVVTTDASLAWPGGVRWPELARAAAVLGPAGSVEAALPELRAALGRRVLFEQPLLGFDGGASVPASGALFSGLFGGWAALYRRLDGGLAGEAVEGGGAIGAGEPGKADEADETDETDETDESRATAAPAAPGAAR